MRTLLHPFSAAPCNLLFVIGEAVGAGRWWGRRKRALAVAAPALGSFHPCNPARTRTHSRINAAESAVNMPPHPSAATRAPWRVVPHVQATEARRCTRAVAEAAASVTGAGTKRMHAEGHQPIGAWGLLARWRTVDSTLAEPRPLTAGMTDSQSIQLHQFEGGHARLGAQEGQLPRLSMVLWGTLTARRPVGRRPMLNALRSLDWRPTGRSTANWLPE